MKRAFIKTWNSFLKSALNTISEQILKDIKSHRSANGKNLESPAFKRIEKLENSE